MDSKTLRQKYLDFFKTRGHSELPSASLIPEDPTTLFTSAGMQPLVPYLLGQPHPKGKRLVICQKCVRTDDIDEVGDMFHHTFFEMLGNWSLGDYFKKETITWSFEFLTQELKLDLNRLYVTCFAGDEDAPKDEESAQVWQSLGIPQERIFFLGKKYNWWGPIGNSGPCGPDTEMHYDVTQTPCGPDCFPGCDCGRFSEIWNDVFMEYNKTAQGRFEKLKEPNVDTGMGLERTLAIVNGIDDDYLTYLWQPVIQKLSDLSGKTYEGQKRQFRIIADHLRAAVFIISDGIEPSNKERGYIPRRLIRRATLQIKRLGILQLEVSAPEIAEIYIIEMSQFYPDLEKNRAKIIKTIQDEVSKFNQTLDRGLKEFHKLQSVNGKAAFDLFQTFGFPWELTAELAEERGQGINFDEFKAEFEKHKEVSRTASAGMFKGGLASSGQQETKYHTATHLLHQALRTVLGGHVIQKGSNITAERLRFDFSHPDKLTEDQLASVVKIVNEQIGHNLPVSFYETTPEEAQKDGAIGAFGDRYGNKVKVYQIGDFSKEVCGGPHVENTGTLGTFKIIKEESVSAGVRRIYATLS